MQRYSALEVRHARGILEKRPDACRLLRHHYDAREGWLVMQCLSSKSTSTCLETTARSAIPYFPWLTPSSAEFNTTRPYRLHTSLLIWLLPAAHESQVQGIVEKSPLCMLDVSDGEIWVVIGGVSLGLRILFISVAQSCLSRQKSKLAYSA